MAVNRYKISNEYGEFTIEEINGRYTIYGKRASAVAEFKKIHKMPPNEYGNFFGREKAGFEACKMIIEKYYNKEQQRNEYI